MGGVTILAKPSARLFVWRDLFVLVDNGRSRPGDYTQFSTLFREQSLLYPTGIGGLVIIPEGAAPPSDEARKALNGELKSLEGRLLCLCWLVEGTGFPAAVARGILTGIRVFGRFSYPTHMASGLGEALEWMVPFLVGVRAEGAEAAASAITDECAVDASLRSAS